MPEQDPLAVFVAARLDETERSAKAAQLRHPGPWDIADNTDSPLPGAVTLYDAQDDSVGVIRGSYAADHIARHDPARVLREVAAKRRILWDHTPKITGRRTACSRCHYGNILGANWPCLTMTSLAAAWSDHSDYDERWKP
jgi:hypothetical protein